MEGSVFSMPEQILGNLPAVWTYLLLLTRYIAFLMLVPGLGGGMNGLSVRTPAAFAFACASLNMELLAPLPANGAECVFRLLSELCLGSAIAFIPLLLVSGAQTAGHLAAGSMGLTGTQLFDPTSNQSVSDLSRLYGDLVVVIFLSLGGHRSAMYAVSGLSSNLVPGEFFITEDISKLFVERVGDIFRVGVMLAAPVIIALLLTNYVMAMISKAVPTINVFIVSFPVTVAVGLILSALALPDFFIFLHNEMRGFDTIWLAIVRVAGD